MLSFPGHSRSRNHDRYSKPSALTIETIRASAPVRLSSELPNLLFPMPKPRLWWVIDTVAGSGARPAFSSSFVTKVWPRPCRVPRTGDEYPRATLGQARRYAPRSTLMRTPGGVHHRQVWCVLSGPRPRRPMTLDAYQKVSTEGGQSSRREPLTRAATNHGRSDAHHTRRDEGLIRCLVTRLWRKSRHRAVLTATICASHARRWRARCGPSVSSLSSAPPNRTAFGYCRHYRLRRRVRSVRH